MRNSIMDRDGIISFNACKDGPKPTAIIPFAFCYNYLRISKILKIHTVLFCWLLYSHLDLEYLDPHQLLVE